MTPLDAFDRHILALLQKNCRLSSESIAEQVGLSPSAVQRRIKRLRDEGVIEQEVAIVAQEASVHPMSFLASIEIERDNYTVLKELTQWARTHACVQQLFYVTGNIDVMLVVSASTTKEYDGFIEGLMSQFPQIKRVTTNVVIDQPIKSLRIPTRE
ncbi:Lrp/AsnC family transcriptional regulator [Vibrio porteresiae]|uniref:Lrp/AsnC family transcriptional regulator n=1 Tax=Vibrio porteresiae DSM 19223 TaxID=1123496 RepID=A0ABZ0QI20_9VIBR|nr:Lrp/AsnC family transcriptional regulator [Vibrio porteresiae]WPC76139.1 Lrp/AsnC family transcriptional regulator [Vibrio porteresiae DSM 19223]